MNNINDINYLNNEIAKIKEKIAKTKNADLLNFLKVSLELREQHLAFLLYKKLNKRGM